MRKSRFILSSTLFVTVIAAITPPGKVVRATDPQNEDAATNYQEGLALVAAEKFEEAIKAFNRAVKLNPDYAKAYRQLGEAYREIGDAKKEVEAYKQVIKYQPNSARAYEDLGGAYPYGEYKKAIEAYDEASRLDPKAVGVHFKLGTLHVNHGKLPLAVAEYKILQTLDAGLAQDLYNLIYKPTVSVVADGVVRLRVIAMDSHGVPIKGLTKSDFAVAEDDAPQTISVTTDEEPSKFYGLAIDTSGSVRPTFNSVVAASKQIIEKLRTDDQALVVRFISSDKIETVQEFTSNKRLLNNGLDTLYIEGGQSAVLDAVYLTAERLAGYKFPTRGIHRVLLLLSDGDDRASYYTIEKVVGLLRSIDVQIFAISLSSDEEGKLNRNPPQKSVALLRTLTSETGGLTFFPKSSAELAATVNAIFDLTRGEYTIEYKPSTPPEPNKYHRVSVSIGPAPSAQNSMVMVRSGYSVPAK
jgi:Ca-activated chloride channel family protein